MNDPTSFEVITFDCYGTLIDWERGLLDAFAGEARRSGTDPFGDQAILSAYHAIEPEVQSGPFLPYRAVLAEVVRRLFARADRPLDERRAGFLAQSLPSWPPFDETGPALRRLADAGFQLGILSNVDDDLIAGTLRNLPEVFDLSLIVTAAAVGSYKPAPGHFEEAAKRIGRRRWLHVAASVFHDIQAATSRSLPCAWVNRERLPVPPGMPPEVIVVHSLHELAELLS